MSAATTMPHTPWPTVKLGDVCALKNGYTPKAEELSEQGVIPYFRISAMNFEGNEKRMIKPTAWLVSKKRCFNAGSIVFPKNGGAVYTRKVRVLEHDSVVDLNTGVCTPDKKTIDCEYLYHWFSNLNITDVVVEGTIPFVDFGMLREVSIPLPPLDVQREIVAKVEAGLKEADALVAYFKRLAALADDTFKAELDETFSTLKDTQKVQLGDLGQMTRGRGIKKSDVISDGKPCIRYGEIYTSFNFILDAPRSFVSDEIYENSVRIKTGDLVFTLTGENREEIAKTLAYLGEDEIAAGGDLAVWSNHGCNPKYLAYLMYSSPLIHEKAMASNGQIIVHASVKKLQSISIPLPSLDIQREIVGKLEAVKARCEQLKGWAERGLKAAEALRKAVLAEAFES